MRTRYLREGIISPFCPDYSLILSFIRGVRVDLTYTGNRPARHYKIDWVKRSAGMLKAIVRMRRIHRTIITIVAVLCVTLFLTHGYILLAVGNFLAVQDKLEPADIIHVIAGYYENRTDYAIQLYKRGYGRQIFFTGGWCPDRKEYHGQLGRERALKQGVPLEAIATNDSKVTSTYAEVVRLKEFIAQSRVPIHSAIVISDPHHMWRARWAYRRVLGDEIELEMAPVPFELSSYKRRWWTDEMSRQYVKNEYLKIAYYIARYQLSFGPLKEWLAHFDRK